jgi:hypothetical protein
MQVLCQSWCMALRQSCDIVADPKQLYQYKHLVAA